MKPFEIVVLSGKGGTGKTTLTSALTALSEGTAVLCDTDVDAPDLWILLNPVTEKTFVFEGMEMASVDPLKCTGCGKCQDFCRFNAIDVKDGKAMVNTSFCEGCGGCELICPENAVIMKHFKQGEYYFSKTAFGPLLHAQMKPGGENSGLLVQLLRDLAMKEAEKLDKELVIVDGPPGIACPTISSLTGADLAIMVTEPSMSGKHDLERLGQLASSLGISACVVINKYDLSEVHSMEIEDLCRSINLPVLGRIPFSKSIVDTISERKIPLEQMKPQIDEIWNKLMLQRKYLQKSVER